MIRCSGCPEGTMVPGHVQDHDVGPLFGLDSVILTRVPALVCDPAPPPPVPPYRIDSLAA